MLRMVRMVRLLLRREFLKAKGMYLRIVRVVRASEKIQAETPACSIEKEYHILRPCQAEDTLLDSSAAENLRFQSKRLFKHRWGLTGAGVTESFALCKIQVSIRRWLQETIP
jgi:hypothetical protein